MIVPLIAISAFLKLICCVAGRLKKVLSLFSYTQAGKIAGFVCAKSHDCSVLPPVTGQACLSKVAGYWSHSFFWHLYGPLHAHKNAQKELDQYPKPSYM